MHFSHTCDRVASMLCVWGRGREEGEGEGGGGESMDVSSQQPSVLHLDVIT